MRNKYYNKFKHILVLYNGFVDYEDPEVIIKYLYKYIYEILKEFKYIPHTGTLKDFHSQFILVYFNYYEKVIAVSNNPGIIALFPNPRYISPDKFSIKNFFIGIAGRVSSDSSYLYGDPVTWNIGYNIWICKKELIISTCQYIFLENYSVFQTDEEYRQSLTINYLYATYKQACKHPGQPDIPTDMVRSCRTESKYGNSIEMMQYKLDFWKKIYNKEYNPRIVEACNKIFERREDKVGYIKPLYLYKEELEKTLEEELKEELKKEL